MRFAKIALLRLRSLFGRTQLDRELDDELQYHLERQIEEEIEAGKSPEDARFAALRSIKDLQQRKEECRDMRRINLLDEAARDLRFALRQLRKSPGFATVAVLSLMLALGANTAIFTLINAVMRRDLPVRAPQQLVSIGDASRPTAHWNGGYKSEVFSYPLYERVRDGNQVFSGVLASGLAGPVDLTIGNGRTEAVRGRLVSGNYFDALGVSPAIGRTFSSEEDRTPGAAPVVVISYQYWRGHFARDTHILSQTIRLNGAPFSVIGVAPPGFTGEVVGSPTDIWISLAMQPQINRGDPRLERRDSNWLLLLGRLKPGMSLAHARAQVTTLVHQAVADFEGGALSPARLREIQSAPVEIEPGGRGFSWVRKHDAQMLFTLMAVVGLILLIGCANIANLLLARATARQREVSVRLAMGASRARLVCQLLTESALLALIGAALGLWLAGWASRLLGRLASVGGPHPIPFDVDIHPDGSVLTFTAALALLTVIFFGLAPALRATRVDLLPALKENARSLSAGKTRLGKLLVMGQVALSLLLLIGAGLFLRSLINLETKEVGYARNRLILLQVDPLASGFTMTQQLTLMNSLLDRLRSVPSVLDASVSENGLFASRDSSSDSIRIDGFAPASKEDMVCAFDQVGPRYFEVLGAPLLAGRQFDSRDNARAPQTAIINESMARFYFRNRNPIGATIHNGSDRYTIIGVVRDMKEGHLKDRTERRFYGPLLQTTDRIEVFNFEIRTRGDVAGAIPSIRAAMRAFDPNLKVLSLLPVQRLVEDSIGSDRLIAGLCGLFSSLSLLLAGIGLYGTVAYATARRTTEIGVRMALGAEQAGVVWMVLRETLAVVVAGIAIGLPAALAVTRLLAATLSGTQANDPVIVGAAVLAMLITGTLAGVLPALRASRIQPMAALR